MYYSTFPHGHCLLLASRPLVETIQFFEGGETVDHQTRENEFSERRTTSDCIF